MRDGLSIRRRALRPRSPQGPVAPQRDTDPRMNPRRIPGDESACESKTESIRRTSKALPGTLLTSYTFLTNGSDFPGVHTAVPTPAARGPETQYPAHGGVCLSRGTPGIAVGP